MASTVIKSFTNFTGSNYTFSNLQSGHQKTYTVSPNTTRTGSMDIPWCDDANDWKKDKYIVVLKGKESLYFIWQHKDKDGDYVRFSKTGYIPGAAPHVPGEASAGGKKALSVLGDGTLFITTYES